MTVGDGLRTGVLVTFWGGHADFVCDSFFFPRYLSFHAKRDDCTSVKGKCKRTSSAQRIIVTTAVNQTLLVIVLNFWLNAFVRPT